MNEFPAFPEGASFHPQLGMLYYGERSEQQETPHTMAANLLELGVTFSDNNLSVPEGLSLKLTWVGVEALEARNQTREDGQYLGLKALDEVQIEGYSIDGLAYLRVPNTDTLLPVQLDESLFAIE